jgi:LPXTG-site transpeptidase (sortase) family protein
MKSKDYMYLAGMTLLIFMATYAVLALAGFVPEQFKFVSTKPPVNTVQNPSNDTNGKNDTVDTQDTNLIPQKIEIPKIGVSSVIQTPQSVDVSALDAALAKGATYYPGSGTLQGGNMFIFGHSTNWKVVNNPAYKTFNNLDKLVVGDDIELTSGGKKYVYAVRSVRLASENDVLVEFDKGGRTLTISTCDTFGQKQDRWVVEAELKEVV